MSNSIFNYKLTNFYSISVILFFLIFITVSAVLFRIYLLNNNVSLFEAFNSKNKNKNIVLIGDSILNNSVYVFENESVADLIKNKMQSVSVSVSLSESDSKQLFYNFAKDGATIQDCILQVENITDQQIATINSSDNSTSIVVSAGGNDILNSRNSESMINTLFEKYTKLISLIKKTFPLKNIVALNLYYPFNSSYKNFHPFIKQWNELLEANQEQNGYKLLKIDSIIVDHDDIVYDIEPSFKGGKKIADAVISN
jgi:hypothetical protein